MLLFFVVVHLPATAVAVFTPFSCACAAEAPTADRPISRSSPSLPLPVVVSCYPYVCMCGAVRVRVAVSLRLLPTTTRLNGKREQRCPLRFHMSSVFENRQARCAHLRRTRQKIQFGSKDQRLFAYKGKAVVDVCLFYFFFYCYYFITVLRSCLVRTSGADEPKNRDDPTTVYGTNVVVWVVGNRNSGGDFRRPY